jgi:hypothetical protein
MKRPFGPAKDSHAKFDDVKANFSPVQLEGIGAVSMAYNELEAELFALFMVATGVDPGLQLDIFTRINGIDGVIEIIKKGTAVLGVNAEAQTELNDALGKGVFGIHKQYRDSVVHARMYNAPLGVGIRAGRQAALFEVLLTKDALEILYEHMKALKVQLRDAILLVYAARDLKRFEPGDPSREPRETVAAHLTAQFLDHRKKRQSLPPLPEFPSELQLRQARDTWLRERQAEQLGWYQQLSAPPRAQRSPAQTDLTEPPFPPAKVDSASSGSGKHKKHKH